MSHGDLGRQDMLYQTLYCKTYCSLSITTESVQEPTTARSSTRSVLPMDNLHSIMLWNMRLLVALWSLLATVDLEPVGIIVLWPTYYTLRTGILRSRYPYHLGKARLKAPLELS